jgi:hypothetical protein
MAWFNRKQKEIPVWVTSEKYDDLILNHANYYLNHYYNKFKHEKNLVSKREKTNLVSVQQLNGQQLVKMRRWCFENESYISSLFDARESYENYYQQFVKITTLMDSVEYYSDEIKELKNTYFSETKMKERLTEYYNQLLSIEKKLQAFDNIEIWATLDELELKKLDLSFEEKYKEGCLYLIHAYVFEDVKMAVRYFKNSYEEDKEMLEDLICYCEEQLNK